MAIKKFNLVMQSARMVTPRVRELTFAREDGEPLDYTAGQFVTLMMEHDGKLLRRSYSLARPPESTDEVTISVTHLEGGRATGILFDMEPGDRVQAMGPAGRFILRDEPPCRYILVATGTGVTPYRSMIPELEQRIDLEDFRAHLLLGVRAPEELLYGDEFLDVANRHEGFEFTACLSRQLSDPPKPNEKRGYVQDVLEDMELDPETDVIYLCGNPEMIDVAAGRLKDRDFPIGNIRREKYVSSN